MRIIAGEWRGRTLLAPPGQATRPTADRTREALFSMLASRIGSFEGLAIADLFAGSGALGLEALSRGAAHCTFVETDRAALEAVRANLAALGAAARATVLSGSAARLPPAGALDLVLADPPYGAGSGSAAVAAVAEAGWLAKGGWMAVETARGEDIAPGPFTIDAGRDVGRARIHIMRYF
jgi:16S rRNA (guanine966-N2)-methyltransferase